MTEQTSNPFNIEDFEGVGEIDVSDFKLFDAAEHLNCPESVITFLRCMLEETDEDLIRTGLLEKTVSTIFRSVWYNEYLEES